MNQPIWLPETCRRIGIDEGTRLYKYRDSLGVTTLGTGYNLQRSDAPDAIAKCGGDWEEVSAAPTAIDSSPENAVAECISAATAQALFEYSFAPIESNARASLSSGIFDSMTDARRFVICDLVYNLGNDGWLAFAGTRVLLNQAQAAKNVGRPNAHDLFEGAADHLTSSDWYGQVGVRAKRDVAMIRAGVWCDATGDGSDIL